MREGNVVRERLEAGERALGVRAKTHAPMLIEVYGDLGYDFVWLDFEHGGPSPHDYAGLEAMTRAADAGGIEPLLRLPGPDPELVRKSLDAGARTLLIPRVETAAEVCRAVEAAHFTYDGDPGERGLETGRDTVYGARENHVRRSDATVLVGAMVETVEAVENLDHILGVPELGFVFVGSGDLSVALGHPAERDHPEVVEAVARIQKRALDAGVPFGMPVDSTAAARAAIDDGAGLVRVGDEVDAVREVLGPRLGALRE